MLNFFPFVTAVTQAYKMTKIMQIDTAGNRAFELDKHIVGQDKAKKAVAIALRNRWRRAQVAEPLRQEITPKNILMIGPDRRRQDRDRAPPGAPGQRALH